MWQNVAKCGKNWFGTNTCSHRVTRYSNNTDTNNFNNRIVQLANQRRQNDERVRAEQHERALADSANASTPQVVNSIVSSIRDPFLREQAWAVAQAASLERQRLEDQQKALFVSAATGDPCTGLKYGKRPCLKHRVAHLGDGSKCQGCYRNIMRAATSGLSAEERHAVKEQRKQERCEERAVATEDKRQVRQRYSDISADTRRAHLGLLDAASEAAASLQPTATVSSSLVEAVSRNCTCPLCHLVVRADCQADHVAGHQSGLFLPPACVLCRVVVPHERCNSCSVCNVFACAAHQRMHFESMHAGKGVALEHDLTKMTLADQEEERLQQLEDQWSDEQDSDFDDGN
jgi:hypothetical protein